MQAMLDTSGLRESRLRLMSRSDDPDSLWDLSDDDRAAIQWAFGRIETLERDLERSRKGQIDALNYGNRMLEKIRSLIEFARQMEPHP